MKNKNSGYLLIQVLVFSAISLVVVGGLISWAGASLKLSHRLVAREQALRLAEAGIDYYRWHLAKFPGDFKDGQTGPGPYVHDFKNGEGEVVGRFTLVITPPSIGSTIITIESTGESLSQPEVKRTIEVQFTKPSLSRYSFITSSDLRFDVGTEVFGFVHANGGVRFDGLAHGLVTSAAAEYQDPAHTGGPEFGVHTHLNIPPPNNNLVNSFRPDEASPTTPVPERPDVFMTGRAFPVSVFDFNTLTAKLTDLRTSAQTDGLYFATSTAQGYNLILKTDGTFDLYKVTALLEPPKNKCQKDNIPEQEGWGTWSVGTQQLLGNYHFPTSGLMFFDDNVWVEGQINQARLTIVASRSVGSSLADANIIVNNNLLYTNYDAGDAIGLIAQGNVLTGITSADTLEIDAALVAKNGRVGRYYYNSNCHPYNTRTLIKVFGAVASNDRYGFSYPETNGENGYQTRLMIYDANLLFASPPSFPSTSEQLQMISWREK